MSSTDRAAWFINLMTAGSAWVKEIPAESWRTMKRHCEEHWLTGEKGHYFRMEIRPGVLRVFSTVEIPTAKQLDVDSIVPLMADGWDKRCPGDPTLLKRGYAAVWCPGCGRESDRRPLGEMFGCLECGADWEKCPQCGGRDFRTDGDNYSTAKWAWYCNRCGAYGDTMEEREARRYIAWGHWT